MSEIERNQPCPCGSGRKYKRCCRGKEMQGRKASPPADCTTHLRFSVCLTEMDPPVWRRFLLRGNASFFDLHDAIQTCGWTDSHMWQFMAGEAFSSRVLAGIPGDDGYSEPDPDARRVPLVTHFTEVGKSCGYLYDFGDSWEHRIILEAVEHRDRSFERALLDGCGKFPPEDCGGSSGYARLREYLKTGEDPWDEDEVMREWTEGMTLDDFDLERAQQEFGEVLSSEPTLAPPRPMVPPVHELKEPSRRATEIDKVTLDVIIQRLEGTLEDLALELGLAIGLRRASYSQINAKIELEVATIRDDGIVMDKQAEEFLRRCREFGLEHAHLGQIFDSGDATYRIIGLKPRAKLPVLCEKMSPFDAEPDHVRTSVEFVREHITSGGGSGPTLRLLPPK